MSSPLLDVKDLSISFSTSGAEVEAVKKISFSVGNGEALGILGESGSGKSVSALSILGLVPPPGRITNGCMKFCDENLIEFFLLLKLVYFSIHVHSLEFLYIILFIYIYI